METNKISLKQIMETKDVITYLEDLIKSFKAGKVVVQQGENHLDLQAPELVDIKVEAKVKKDKSKFGLELSWRSMPAEAVEPVTIKSKVPTKTTPKEEAAKPAKTTQKKSKTSIKSEAADEKVYFGAGSRIKNATPEKTPSGKTAKKTTN